ncbi:MAG: cation diffusion facilitator family transporter [Candidatus Sumerlaeia bacterium]
MLWIVLGLNWAVSAGKIIVGVLTGRLTILADGLHSLLDGANNLVGIVAIHVASRPPDADHPYGHRKFENVAAMLIGGLIVLIAWELGDNIVRTVYGHLDGDAAPAVIRDGGRPDWAFVLVLVGTILVNLAVARFETIRGEALRSPLLKADAGHTSSDVAVTSLSLASLLLGGRVWWVDPLLALGVLGFLVHTAWKIIMENVHAFTDRARLDPEHVRQVAEGVTGVMASSGVRSHGPENDIHLDLCITVDRSLTAEQTEEIEHRVRQSLREAFPGLTLIAIHHQTAPPDDH